MNIYVTNTSIYSGSGRYLVLRPQGAEEAAVRVGHILARTRGLGWRGLSGSGLVTANLNVTCDTS